MTRNLRCEECGKYPNGCECEVDAQPETNEMTVSCNRCGYSGTIAYVKVHSCYVQENGGRCEDYPCCGHTDGGGCQTRPEHTSEYWSNLMSSMDPDEYDLYCDMMDRQEAGY